MKRYSIVALVVPLLVLVTAAACSTSSANNTDENSQFSSAGFPVDVRNCGRTLHFDKPPARIVSGWSTSTELLIELGVADKIVGQYNTTSGTPSPKHAAAVKKVPVLAENAPTREALLAARPDLIWADGDYLFDGQQLPTIADLNAQGIQVMILSGFCTGDATAAKVRDVTTDLSALGTILGLRDRADQIQGDIEERLNQIAERIKSKDPVPVAMISTFNGTIYTYDGVYTDIARLAGATNIYAGTLPAGKYFAEVSREDITKKNPSTLIYLLSGTENPDTAADNVKTMFPTLDAVKQNRVIVLPQSNSTNLNGVDGVVSLTAALHP